MHVRERTQRTFFTMACIFPNLLKYIDENWVPKLAFFSSVVMTKSLEWLTYETSTRSFCSCTNSPSKGDGGRDKWCNMVHVEQSHMKDVRRVVDIMQHHILKNRRHTPPILPTAPFFAVTRTHTSMIRCKYRASLFFIRGFFPYVISHDSAGR